VEVHLFRSHALVPKGLAIEAMQQAPGPGHFLAISRQMKSVASVSNLYPESLFNLL
jgi:hypothetical protein